MKDKLPNPKVLVWDIETTSVDIDEAELRLFGAYSYITNKRYVYTEHQIDKIKEILKAHDVHVGYNLKEYDIPVLNKYDILVGYTKVIDLLEVLRPARIDPKTKERTSGKDRGMYMGLRNPFTKDNLLREEKLNWKLSTVVKALNLGSFKEDLDYKLLKKPSHEWSVDERQKILSYLNQDITITKKLFEYVNNFFYGMTEYLPESDVLKYNYITSSVASLAYKALCHYAGLPETYNERTNAEKYQGGFVFEPTQENHIGTVLCLDFNSLYPGIIRMFNLLGPAPQDYPEEHTYKGDDLFQVYGQYKTDDYSNLCEGLGYFYSRRKELKANKDPRQLLIKIIINSIYGASASPIFAQLYNHNAARDCTRIGRQMVQYAAKYFDERGFTFLYGDTDSVYVALNENTIDYALEVANEIDAIFKEHAPFPNDDFGFGLDAVLDAIWFFPDEDGDFKKKNYAYIERQKDGSKKLIIKGRPIIKSNASRLAKRIYNKYLRNQIIEKTQIEFPEGYIKQLVYHELNEDLSLATQSYNTKPYDSYSVKTSLYAQIAEVYGEGTHDLIPNNRIGVGKNKKYCTIQEFKEGNGRVEDIDLTLTMNNLDPFIRKAQQSLADF